MTHREGRAAAIVVDPEAEAYQGRCIPPHVSAMARWREGRDQRDDGALQRRDILGILPSRLATAFARPAGASRTMPALSGDPREVVGGASPRCYSIRAAGERPFEWYTSPETAKPGIAARPAVAALRG